MTWLAKIDIKGSKGGLVLAPDWSWSTQDPKLAPLARELTVQSQPPYYSYSPSHGTPGHLLANRLASSLGKKVSFPSPKGSGDPRTEDQAARRLLSDHDLSDELPSEFTDEE